MIQSSGPFVTDQTGRVVEEGSTGAGRERVDRFDLDMI
jgi:hypothetical protein